MRMENEFTFISFLDELEKKIEQYSESIALSSASKQLTYAELNESIIRVSRYLGKIGIQKGDIIALWVNKSIDYICLILGIWKLGAVFLPLDIKTPVARIKWILKDARAKMLITDNDNYSNEIDSITFKNINEIQKNLDLNRGTSSNWIDLTSQDTAYIIYTSGSTGNPKGVIITHEGIVNFLKEQIKAFQITNKSKILQYLSIGFDASLSEIGISLLSGATLRIEHDDKLKNPDKLIMILETERITHICLPPSLLPVLEIEKIPNSLNTIIIGGEVCPIETVKKWSKKFNIVNVYGPTEATVCSSIIVCESNWDMPLIGYPIPHREFYILDKDKTPVNNGESGELFLSGVGLARGYLNQEELTKEKFIFLNGKRMYKTGDLVRKHSTEKIEFIGRIDRQFKLNGNLIEPVEIERALCDHFLISFAFVLKVKLNREILVAYILLKEDEKRFSEIELRRLLKNYLKKMLPHWMAPDKFIVLKKIPLNTNGKLAIEKFPEVKMEKKEDIPYYAKPLTSLEKELCKIYERILMISPIGLNDSFYDMGGDSLSIISLVSECGLLGISISLESFVKDPTVKGILLSAKRNENSKYENANILRDEAKLGDEIINLIGKTRKKNNKRLKVLITGATGFLGSRVLWELSKNKEYEIFCIARDILKYSPRKKIENQLGKQGIEISNWKKIHFIEGDISCRNFKMSESEWEYMADNIDSVIHFAAEVNLVKPYSELKESNVDGTREILKFCLTGLRKELHYASTLSVFVSSDDIRGKYCEEDRLDLMNVVYGGYAQSKWVSEKILLNAIDSGCDLIKIYRFGLITGDSNYGYTKPDDFFTRFIRATKNLKSFPFSKEIDLKVDITPVDFAGRIFTQLFQIEANDCIFHIANPKALSFGEYKKICKELILDLTELTETEFIDSLRKLKDIDLYFYLSMSRLYLNSDMYNNFRPFDLFQATGKEFDFTNVKKNIQNYEKLCPEPNRDLLQKYINQVI